MAGSKKITVVISQHQGKNPAKRELEEELAMQCVLDPEVEVEISIIPNLYDLSHDHSGMLFLKNIPGDVIVLSWLYPRAAHWILDRAGVKGHLGTVLVTSEEEDDDDSKSSDQETGQVTTSTPDDDDETVETVSDENSPGDNNVIALDTFRKK